MSPAREHDEVSEAIAEESAPSRWRPRSRASLLAGCIIIVSLTILTAAVVYSCLSSEDPSSEFFSDCGKPGPSFHRDVSPAKKDVWKAVKQEYPFYSLFFTIHDTRPFCAGVVVAKHWILTSAHCLAKKKNRSSSIRVASGITLKSNLTAASRTIQRIVIHKDYNYPEAKNNIALAKVSTHAISHDFYTTRVCLQRSKNESVGQLLIAGFGTIFDVSHEKPDKSGEHLRVTRVDALDDTTCREEFSDNYDDKMLCAQHWNSSSYKSGIGDAGGPLFHTDEFNVTTLIALNTCDAQGQLGLYLRVADYYNWISNNIN